MLVNFARYQEMPPSIATSPAVGSPTTARQQDMRVPATGPITWNNLLVQFNTVALDLLLACRLEV